MYRQISHLSDLKSFRWRNFFLFLLLYIFLPQSGFTQNPPEITLLEIDKPIEREIKGGEKHFFQISFTENQYAKIIVKQRGVDIVVRRIDANGKISVEYDFDPRNTGEEPVEMTAESAGEYQLSVEPRQRNAAQGSFEIRVIEVRPADEKDFQLDDARLKITAAQQFWRIGDLDKALPLAETALAIREKELGADNFDVTQALFALGNILSDQGDYQQAEAFYKRTLETREKLLGKDHISVSAILNNFATLYKDRGEYNEAELFLERALKIREKELEPNHILIASILMNLGNVNSAKGNIQKAEAFYKRVLEIREKAHGAESAEVAVALNNIANLYEDFAKAEPLYLRALAIREKVFGAEHQEVGQTLYNLAILYANARKYDKALNVGERSLNIFEKTLGAEHPFTSYPLNFLAIIYKVKGNFEKAEAFYLRSIAIKEKTQGNFHPSLGGAFSNLANLYAVKGEIEKAIAAQTRANEIFEYNIALNLTIGSESEKINFIRTISDSENRTFSLNALTAPDSAEAAALAASTVLRRKGRVLDALSDNLAALRRRFNSRDQALLDQLNETNTNLSKLILEGAQEISAEEHRKKITGLEKEKENLEDEISRRSAGFYERKKAISLESVQESIPTDAVLLEIALYRPVSPQISEFETESSSNANLRYAAYVIRKNGAVKWKDLGAAKQIDAAIDDFRKALRDPKRKDVKMLSRALDEKVLQPVRQLFGNAKHLLISPDGKLNLIPFEALFDENNRFFVENYRVTYLTSGRDLLRLQTARKSKAKPLIIANPLFGEADSSRNFTGSRKAVSSNKKHRSITATRNLSDTYFTPLGGTMQEARSIQAIFPEAEFLTGREAGETALKQITAPQILHIATHGFFLEDKEISENENAKVENPLLRSGLAFAGANRRKDGNDDGILTALEASGLNLWGTKLVVLSACDTGLGEVRNGEGVYGLRRAFVLAGTESLVMSLWAVSDFATRELMTDYYKNLKQGTGRGESLRLVQLEMLKRENRQHPFYWASFIQSGEWANLDGKR